MTLMHRVFTEPQLVIFIEFSWIAGPDPGKDVCENVTQLNFMDEASSMILSASESTSSSPSLRRVT